MNKKQATNATNPWGLAVRMLTDLFAFFWAGMFLWWMMGAVFGGHYSAILCSAVNLTCARDVGMGWGFLDFFILISPLLILVASLGMAQERKNG